MKATFADFVLLFQYDLKLIFEAFKLPLGVAVTYHQMVPKPGRGKFIMTRFDSMTADVAGRGMNYTFQIVMGRAGNLTAQKDTPADFSVEYTFERVVRLIQANGNLKRHAGIHRLIGLEGGVSPPGANLFVPGANIEEAVLAVTYSRDEALLYPSNQ